MFQDGAHGVVAHRGELLAGDYTEGQEAHGGEQEEHRDESQEGGQGDILAVACALRVGGGSLHADEGPDGEQHHALHLVTDGQSLILVLAEGGGAAPEVRGEHVRVEADEGYEH